MSPFAVASSLYENISTHAKSPQAPASNANYIEAYYDSTVKRGAWTTWQVIYSLKNKKYRGFGPSSSSSSGGTRVMVKPKDVLC